MGRRRVNWIRLGLKWGFLICLDICLLIGLVALWIDNDRRGEEALASEMADEVPPVVELFGGELITLAVGDALVEPGWVAYDDRTIPEVMVESTVNAQKPGEYRINYRAVDEAGNATDVTREVKVIQPAGKVYLTFDDGPSEYTNALLDTLKKYNVSATFFVTGYGDDEIIRREYNDGHAVGVHTFSHRYADIYANKENYFADLDYVKRRVREITGVDATLMRFPGGSSNLVSSLYDHGRHIMSDLVHEVGERGMTYFDWNVDSDDAGRATTAEEVCHNVTGALASGGDLVVLQHDTKAYSVEAVKCIIQYGLEHGFVFKKLSANSYNAHHSVNN